MTSDEKKSWAEELLKRKAEELGRLPKKDDFDEPTRSRIKAFLGPWPRALEAAGLKEAKPVPVKSKKRKRATISSKNQTVSARQKLEKHRTEPKEQNTFG
ncbi:MAG: hypothetical protein IJZ57_06860 [Clostridia bacterium]|nr:hypothetical protein [Clostridia bacterium]MBQ8783472.1 hypothetical protein [Clostridia bacterium]